MVHWCKFFFFKKRKGMKKLYSLKKWPINRIVWKTKLVSHFRQETRVHNIVHYLKPVSPRNKDFWFSFLNSSCPHTKTTPLPWDFLRLVCLCFRLFSIFPEIPICFYLFIYFCGFCAAWWFIICGNWDCFVLRFVYVFHFYCHGFWCQFTIILQAPINEWKL